MEQKELAGKILEELAAIGFASYRDYVTLQGDTLVWADWSALPPEKLAAVAGVEKGTGGVKLKLYDKMKALELMGKIIGIFDDKPQQVEDSGLLQAILDTTVEEVSLDDIPEVFETAADGYDLVEPQGSEAL